MQIVFDNYNFRYKELKKLWGFSIYLKEQKLLFDTGSNGRALLKNLQTFDIDIKEIKYLFISHSHWDHIGGLDSVLELNSDITIFVPRALSKHLIDDLKSLTKEVIVINRAQKLFDNIYTTGMLGADTPEQSLIIDSEKPTVIAGCAHFGIENIVKKASDYLGREIHSCIGGFHLIKATPQEIQDVISSLKSSGVTQVCPTHCSGDRAIEIFKQSFQDGYIEGGLGARL
jgi:7,8-dihydropterin-6-yl-methyl-4-(beta-D-ribofuranosyl)aminobenzene 5'-phosphate synthase